MGNNLSRELVQSSMREALRTIRTFEQASREHGMILEVVSNFDLLTKTINTNRLQQYIMGTSILLLNPPKDGEPLLTIVEGEDSQLPLIRMEIQIQLLLKSLKKRISLTLIPGILIPNLCIPQYRFSY